MLSLIGPYQAATAAARTARTVARDDLGAMTCLRTSTAASSFPYGSEEGKKRDSAPNLAPAPGPETPDYPHRQLADILAVRQLPHRRTHRKKNDLPCCRICLPPLVWTLHMLGCVTSNARADASLT